MDRQSLMNSELVREAAVAVRAFVDELAAGRMLVATPAGVLRISASGVEALRKTVAGEERLLTVPGRPQEAVKTAAAELARELGSACLLDVTADLAVQGQMVLPAESDDVLQAILRNKVESIAPWPLGQSLHGQRIMPLAEDPRRVGADVAVVSRHLLEEIAGHLAAAGTRVKGATVELASGERAPMSFGAGEDRADAQRRAVHIASGFAVAAAALTGLGMLLVLHGYGQLAAVRAETAELTASLSAGQGGGAQSQLGAANLLHERRRQRLPAIAILDQLSAALPETAWLVSLSLEDTKLELKGKGRNVPALIEAIEKAEAFSNVNFSSATQLDAEQNAEEFAISASIDAISGERP